MNLKKCYFMKEELMYLGFVISRQGLLMYRSKIKVILEWPEPTNVIEVRIFHGISSFYRMFIKDFSQICALFTTCMKKGEFKWPKAARQYLEKMKQKLT